MDRSDKMLLLQANQVKAMRFERPEEIPVTVSLLPATWMKYGQALEDLVARHSNIFPVLPTSGDAYDNIKGTYVEGDHTDHWGCVWSNVRTGMQALVTHHPLATREDVRNLKPPAEDVHIGHGFMFLRLTDLRGFSELMIDFADEPPELQMLIDIVFQYNMRQVHRRLEIEAEGSRINFGDDLGMQASLPMSPEQWRKYLKPCYKAFYSLCHEAGHDVYMHTDGHIYEIIPDLVECGVNVINPQVRANGLDNLARVCKGKVCVALDLDRQMFPFCTPEDIDAHVREAVEMLGAPEGGLWLEAECAPDVPLENIDAICTAMAKYRTHV